MFNMDKLKQAGSLMKKMNGLKKKIDKLETIAESKDGNIRVVVQGTSNIKSIKIDEDFLPQVSAKDLEKNITGLSDNVLVANHRKREQKWYYTTEKPAPDWSAVWFRAQEAKWKSGIAPFGGSVPNEEGKTKLMSIAIDSNVMRKLFIFI